jgi:hypothetical protein
MRSAIVLFASLTLVTGCKPKYEGTYDGQASLTLGQGHKEPMIDADLSKERKFVVHVSVDNESVTLTGAPLAGCTPMVRETSRKGMLVAFDGGLCKVITRGGLVPLADGTGIATLKGDELEMSYSGTDLLSFKATRRH